MARILFNSKGAEEYKFLSNFYYAPFSLDGNIWPTIEHYYQAAKTNDDLTQTRIRELSTAAEAKAIGQNVKLRPDWEEVKIPIIRRAVRAKFLQNENLASKLVETWEKVLIEYAPWGDRFWGIDKAGVGENNLGKVLMEVRAELILYRCLDM